jgi:hypothetical protein
MALIKCEECGREVSDKAPACPGCGAPVNISETTATAPDTVSFEDGRFRGTRAMVLDLAVKAVQAARYKVDQINESAGVVGFTTGMTMGSWSGVSGSIVLSETQPFMFRVSGTGKQNVRGGQIIALDLFGESKAKVEKVICEMQRLAS